MAATTSSRARCTIASRTNGLRWRVSTSQGVTMVSAIHNIHLLMDCGEKFIATDLLMLPWVSWDGYIRARRRISIASTSQGGTKASTVENGTVADIIGWSQLTDALSLPWEGYVSWDWYIWELVPVLIGRRCGREKHSMIIGHGRDYRLMYWFSGCAALGDFLYSVGGTYDSLPIKEIERYVRVFTYYFPSVTQLGNNSNPFEIWADLWK